MSKVDDELTRRLRGAERPVDAEDLFEGLERRRSHRERVRRVQAGMLAFAVLAGTAGGFIALREVFGESGRGVGKSPVLAENGEIIFSLEGTDGYAHLYAMQPDGSERRQITDFGTNDTDPTVSPDGRTIAFVHQLEDVDPALATIPIKGGTVTWLSDPGIGVRDPAWSPDGSTIAFVGVAERTQRIMAFDMASGEVTPIVGDREEEEFANPAWSPDGKWLVFSARASGTSDPWELWTMTPDGTQRREVGWASPERNAAAWSPDGTRIAVLLVHGDRGEPDEVWTIAPDGTDETRVATAVKASLEPDLAWAPDGSALLVSDGEWIYRVDPTPQGDPDANLVQLVRGRSATWQPVAAGSEPKPSPTSEPTVSPSPEPAGRDIGLGFNACNLERLGGIDFLGGGTQGQAWTGAEVKENGSCPDRSGGSTYLVAADVDGDGVADASSQTVELCFYCRPFDTVDFDADGDDELVVMASQGSVPTFMVYDLRGTDGARRIEPVLVAEPGHPEAGEEAGEPLSFSTGGDEGYSGWVRCENFPGPVAPVLVITWRNHLIEGDTMEVHETRVILETDGMFHVVGTTDYSAPVTDAIPGVSDTPACGVDWQIWD